MNDDAQGAILKTLEEPPAGRHDRALRRRGVAAAAHDPLALRADPPRPGRARARSRRSSPTTASPIRPLAARLARLAGGRPGLALAYARAPEALRIRGEIARTLLDLLDVGSGRAAWPRCADPSRSR